MKPTSDDRGTPIGPSDYEGRHGHAGCVVWLTGLSASGKSTIANHAARRLFDRGVHAYVLDGDQLRRGLTRDLGFSPEAREENIRRAGEVARLLREVGFVVFAAFISPYRRDRDAVRAMLPAGDFVEVYVEADLDTCIARDPKGLYARALRGEVREFTGVSAPYEPPEAPELVVNTTVQSVEQSVQAVVDLLGDRIVGGQRDGNVAETQDRGIRDLGFTIGRIGGAVAHGMQEGADDRRGRIRRARKRGRRARWRTE